jgi:hypothetical protein
MPEHYLQSIEYKTMPDGSNDVLRRCNCSCGIQLPWRDYWEMAIDNYAEHRVEVALDAQGT